MSKRSKHFRGQKVADIRDNLSYLLKKKLAAHPLPKTTSCCWPLLIQLSQARKTKIKLAQEHCSPSVGAACLSTTNTGPGAWKTQTKIFLTFIVEIAISHIFWCPCCWEIEKQKPWPDLFVLFQFWKILIAFLCTVCKQRILSFFYSFKSCKHKDGATT